VQSVIYGSDAVVTQVLTPAVPWPFPLCKV